MDSLDAQLDEAKIASGRVRRMRELAESEWAADWAAVRSVSDRAGGEYQVPGRPWHFSEAKNDSGGAEVVARQGEHNNELLREIGLTEAQIEALKMSGALVSAPGTK
jgi:crotonobetainyl-CoA:carnitine CoA-transferase CaiB-like acyl-CoA transferase